MRELAQVMTVLAIWGSLLALIGVMVIAIIEYIKEKQDGTTRDQD